VAYFITNLWQAKKIWSERREGRSLVHLLFKLPQPPLKIVNVPSCFVIPRDLCSCAHSLAGSFTLFRVGCAARFASILNDPTSDAEPNKKPARPTRMGWNEKPQENSRRKGDSEQRRAFSQDSHRFSFCVPLVVPRSRICPTSSLTQIAHNRKLIAASRTFRTICGLCPCGVAYREQWLQLPASDEPRHDALIG
jgi:hypothetical protein